MAAASHDRRRPVRHFPADMLFDFATGSLPEPQAILVATHLALCTECRQAAAAVEAIGGALLAEIPPAPMAPDALARVMARLGAPDPRAVEPLPAASPLPSPLCDYLPGDPANLAWQSLAAGIDEVALRPRLPAEAPWPAGVEVSLVRFAPGAVAPRHSHLGHEATVIVQGGFSDEFGQYERGDAWIVDRTVAHRPVALPDEPCLCLVYLDAPLQATGG